MKKIIISFLAAIMAVAGAEAKKMSDLKIYINPGHGGYTGNDRPIKLEIFPANDTLSFWESKSNLYKGLHMYHILDSLGAKPYISRIKNNEADDRDLNNISAEANSLGVDLFFSIHSNAGENVNFPLMLYRENERGVPRYPENITLSNITFDNLVSRKLTEYSRTSRYVAGDITFYWNQWKTGLGVLRKLYVVGLLSEGQMHEYQPEAYRLLNDDYCWLEAWLFVKSIMEFENTTDRFVTGNVAGVIYDDHNIKEKDFKLKFSTLGRDKYAFINGAYVELLDQSGKVVQKRTTDNLYNGVFVFRNVTPGNYKLRVTHPDYHPYENDVVVTANDVTYDNPALCMNRPGNLDIAKAVIFTESSTGSVNVIADPIDGATDVNCSSQIRLDFNYDIDVASFEKAFKITPEVRGTLRYSNSYKTVVFKPDFTFESQTQYTISIDKSAKSADHMNADPTLGKDINMVFTTNEVSKVELLSTYPAENGEVDFRSPTLEFRFSNEIITSGMESKIVVKDANGNVLKYKSRGSSYNKLSNKYGNALMKLNADLVPGQKYTVSLANDIRDKSGLPLGYDLDINFTAVDNGQVKDGDIVDDFENDGLFVGNETLSKGMSAKPTYQKSTTDKLFDKASAKFTYNFNDFRGGDAYWTYIPAGEPITVMNNDKLGFHVNGDFNDHELYVELSAGVDVKYYPVCKMNFKGWQYHSFVVEGLLDETPYAVTGFRLKQVESPITQSGVFCIDDMVKVNNNTGVEGIAADNASGIEILAENGTVTVVTSEEKALVTLYDMLGRIVERTSSKTISAAPGQYVVKVQTARNVIAKRIQL